jgi:hypothetical protein
MNSIQVECPAASTNVLVTASGAGSGAQGTICVRGKYLSTFEMPFFTLVVVLFKALLRWLRSIFKPKPMTLTLLTAQKIRVRVILKGDPAPKETDPGTDVSSPSTNWCARQVPVPAWSSAGVALTVYAWLLDASNTVLDGPHIVDFTGGGSNPGDCCSGCGSGHDLERSTLVGELAAHPDLEITVPDGPNAGMHRATNVSALTWAATIHAVTYKVFCNGNGALVIQGPSSSVPSANIDSGPFSAIFPGAVVGARGDIVVTKA